MNALKSGTIALAGVAPWIECLPANLKSGTQINDFFSLSLSNQSINKLCKSLICKLDVFTLFGLIYDSINFLYPKICSLNFHQRHYEYAMFPTMCLKILKVYQPCFLIERDKKQLSIAESYITHLPELKG